MNAIPPYVKEIMDALWAAGAQAYLVGGCVRDSLLGTVPADWDLCTDALPTQVERVLAGHRIVETGIRHGTVTVVTDGGPVEVTTFRADGPYRDSRRPESVTFVPRLADDLARRDFTVNAMAMGPDGAVTDLYGGREDLAGRVIRCVGDPDARFGEDALRILRALRFASRLGFAVQPATAESLLKNRALLDRIARERVFSELKGLLTGGAVSQVLIQYAPVIFQLIPELAPAAGFGQRNPHHIHDVWTHTALAVGAVDPDPALRLAMLLHDVGKPETFFLDEAGVGHFYGHAQRGAEIADGVLRRLRCDNDTRRRVCLLIENHAVQPPQTPRAMRRLLAKVGPDRVRDLVCCWRADCADRTAAVRAEDAAYIDEAERLLDAALAERAPCLGVKSLAVDGRDILALGLAPGPAVGRVLAALFEEVADGAPNERQALLARAGQLVKKGLE